MEGNSIVAKVLMIPGTSRLTKGVRGTDPTRALYLAKIYDLIGNASRSAQERTQPARRPASHGKRVVETDSPG